MLCRNAWRRGNFGLGALPAHVPTLLHLRKTCSFARTVGPAVQIALLASQKHYPDGLRDDLGHLAVQGRFLGL